MLLICRCNGAVDVVCHFRLGRPPRIMIGFVRGSFRVRAQGRNDVFVTVQMSECIIIVIGFVTHNPSSSSVERLGNTRQVVRQATMYPATESSEKPKKAKKSNAAMTGIHRWRKSFSAAAGFAANCWVVTVTTVPQSAWTSLQDVHGWR